MDDHKKVYCFIFSSVGTVSLKLLVVATQHFQSINHISLSIAPCRSSTLKWLEIQCFLPCFHRGISSIMGNILPVKLCAMLLHNNDVERK
jgi:hypothetical protein